MIVLSRNGAPDPLSRRLPRGRMLRSAPPAHGHSAHRPDGETGRRKGLKIPQPQGYAGSTPAPGTNAEPSLFTQGRLFHVGLRAPESSISAVNASSAWGIHFSASAGSEGSDRARLLKRDLMRSAKARACCQWRTASFLAARGSRRPVAKSPPSRRAFSCAAPRDRAFSGGGRMPAYDKKLS